MAEKDQEIPEEDQELIKIIDRAHEITSNYLKSLKIDDEDYDRETIHEEMKELIQKAKEIEFKKDLKEFLEEFRSSGVIALKDQEIKIHKNGAKVTIPQTYIKDGLLNEKKRYTLVFIPS